MNSGNHVEGMDFVIQDSLLNFVLGCDLHDREARASPSIMPRVYILHNEIHKETHDYSNSVSSRLIYQG